MPTEFMPAPAAEAPSTQSVASTPDLARDPLSEMGYTPTPIDTPLPEMPDISPTGRSLDIATSDTPQADPLSEMGYQFTPEKNSLPPESPSQELPPQLASAEVDNAISEQVTVPEPSMAPESGDGAEKVATSLPELESQANAEAAEIAAIAPQSAASAFGSFVGQKVAELKRSSESFTNPSNSEIVTVSRKIGEAFAEFKAAFAAEQVVSSELTVRNGQLTFESPAANPATVEPPPIIAPPILEAPQPLTTQPEVLPSTPETRATELPRSQAEMQAQAYETLTTNPELLTSVQRFSEFFAKHSITQEAQQAFLAKRFGEDIALLVDQLQKDGTSLEILSDMHELGFSTQEAVAFLAPTGADQRARANTEAPLPEPLEFTRPRWTQPMRFGNPNIDRTSIPQAVRERVQPRSAAERSPAQQEKQVPELFEQISKHKGYAQSDLPLGTQLSSLRSEALRLQLKLEETPPSELERHVRSSVSSFDQSGREKTAWTTFEYDGNIDSPEAISAALLDTSVKLESIAAVSKAQNSNAEDKLAAAVDLLKERFGKSASVELRRADDENGNPIARFEPATHSLAVTYENGIITLKVQPTLGSAGDSLESNFTRKEA